MFGPSRKVPVSVSACHRRPSNSANVWPLQKSACGARTRITMVSLSCPRTDVSIESAKPVYPPAWPSGARVPSPESPSRISPSGAAIAPGTETSRTSEMNVGSVSRAGPSGTGTITSSAIVATDPSATAPARGAHTPGSPRRVPLGAAAAIGGERQLAHRHPAAHAPHRQPPPDRVIDPEPGGVGEHDARDPEADSDRAPIAALETVQQDEDHQHLWQGSAQHLEQARQWSYASGHEQERQQCPDAHDQAHELWHGLTRHQRSHRHGCSGDRRQADHRCGQRPVPERSAERQERDQRGSRRPPACRRPGAGLGFRRVATAALLRPRTGAEVDQRRPTRGGAGIGYLDRLGVVDACDDLRSRRAAPARSPSVPCRPRRPVRRWH